MNLILRQVYLLKLFKCTDIYFKLQLPFQNFLICYIRVLFLHGKRCLVFLKIKTLTYYNICLKNIF